jgi:hypothetical protein
MLENKEAIILDSTNNVFVGPNEFFKIVIDEFDGKAVQAWHFEDAKGTESDNLAVGEGTHIDALINANCRSVWHFSDRIAPALVTEQQRLIAAMKAELAELKAKK